MATQPPANPPAVAHPTGPRDGGENGDEGSDVAGDDARRAAALLGAIAPLADRRSVPLESMALHRLAAGVPAVGRVPAGRQASTLASVDGDDPAGLVGRALEGATDGDRRRAQGLYVTPTWLAADLARRALADLSPAADARGADGNGGASGAISVCDPACGGGAFLVAAAEVLHHAGLDRRTIVRRHLWGADIDRVGLAAAEAALALWAGEVPPAGRLVVADPLHSGAAAWTGAPADGFDAVIGNPPFQSQLGRSTVRDDATRLALRARFGGAVRAYTDTAWLFLLLGCELTRPGGRIVLLQPTSVVGARDAAAVRAAVDARAGLEELWLDDGRLFSAAVRVCAPVLRRTGGSAYGADGADDVWAREWARVTDLPTVELGRRNEATLGSRAVVVAGFRDEYYGLAGAVCESDELAPGTPVAPLVTSGAIDWASTSWGVRPVRYTKRRWRSPVVDPGRLGDEPSAAHRWLSRTAGPKLLVATQTRVVEAAVDVDGGMVPSVPALAVRPTDLDDPDELWRLGAAVLSPAATSWMASRCGATGLDRGALKVTGPDLAALPLPSDAGAWHEATLALRRLVDGGGPAVGSQVLELYLDAIGRAYRTSSVVTAWWRARAGSALAPAIGQPRRVATRTTPDGDGRPRPRPRDTARRGR